MDVLWSKLLVMVLLGVVSLVVGFVPLLARSYSSVDSPRKRTALSVLLCFGGGVLLATCFVHMLPEVRIHITIREM
jgi:zinc transporter 1/2/3